MAVLPLNNPKFRAFDANGNPLSGGKLYSYAAGTSTPLDTYTTRAGDVANANPVVLNANGEADVWTTPGVLYKFVLKNASDVTQWTVDNVPSGSPEESASADLANAVDPGGRLTLTSATPVTTAGVSGATSVLYVPYKHNKVPLYDGSTWALHAIATELSQLLSDATKSPAAATNGNEYDMFIWNDSGTLRVSRGPAWSSDTNRGTGSGTTELERVGGRYVNKYAISNGPAAQRGLYVGTIRMTGGAVADNSAFRHVWNAYNRVSRRLQVVEATTSWSYSTATWRQANGSTANQLDFVIGLSEEPVFAQAIGRATSNADGVDVAVGVGLDVTNANSAATYASLSLYGIALSSSHSVSPLATYEAFPGIGRHFLAWLEWSEAAGTTTWLGTVSTSVQQTITGLTGHIFA